MSVVVIKGTECYVIAKDLSLSAARELKAQVINLATSFVVVRIVPCIK